MRRFTLFVLSLCAALPLPGQTPSASVVGRVVDVTGAVVPGVAIKISNLDTNQSHDGSTNGAGDYTIPYLNPGRYVLQAEGPGFRLYKHAEFTLQVDQSLRIDIHLEIGATTDSITVTETLPALNTESGAPGDVTTNAELTEMPLARPHLSYLPDLTRLIIPA